MNQSARVGELVRPLVIDDVVPYLGRAYDSVERINLLDQGLTSLLGDIVRSQNLSHVRHVLSTSFHVFRFRVGVAIPRGSRVVGPEPGRIHPLT